MTEPHILVSDDESSVRRTLRANLKARGYDVTAVETGEELLLRRRIFLQRQHSVAICTHHRQLQLSLRLVALLPQNRLLVLRSGQLLL